MKQIRFERLGIPDIYLITNYIQYDNRGCFMKCFEKNIYENIGISFDVHETFVSVSAKNVIRGLHFQTNNCQAKIVSVIRGKVWDVVVDLRVGSPTYKKWISEELNAENHKALYIPCGFAHGFVSLENETIMLYQCNNVYDKDTDKGIRIDDIDIGIKWPIDLKKAICSDRDLNLMSIEEYEMNPMKIE